MDLMNTVLPYLLSGVSVGGQYALIAIGYTMVYGILRLINFAHGDVFMVAGLMMVYLSASLPLYLAVPLVAVLTVLLGFAIERVAYKPLDLRSDHGLRRPHQAGHPHHPVFDRGPGGYLGMAYQPHQGRHGYAGRLPGL